MKCTDCPDLGQRIDPTTFICDYSGAFLTLEDLRADVACAKHGDIVSVKIDVPKVTCQWCGEKFQKSSMKIHEKACKRKLGSRQNAKKLKALRKEWGLTQGDLARMIGVSQSTIGAYELGRLALDDSRLAEIEEVIKCRKSNS